jgi:uncharacterized membrane protein
LYPRRQSISELESYLPLSGCAGFARRCCARRGVIPLRDEDAAYKRQTLRFQALGSDLATHDRAALAAAFQITMLEGIEVVFIVLAVGAANRDLPLPAALGAGVAFLPVRRWV